MGEFDTVMQNRDEVEDCITIKNSPNPSRRENGGCSCFAKKMLSKI